jgi:hypothetical protein
MTSVSVGKRRILLPVSVGLLAGAGLSLLYFAIVSWAESPRHALEQFWTDRWIVLPIMIGFSVQAALYTILKKRLYLPAASPGPSGTLMGAGGTTSTAAMISCCAHHAQTSCAGRPDRSQRRSGAIPDPVHVDRVGHDANRDRGDAGDSDEGASAGETDDACGAVIERDETPDKSGWSHSPWH